MNVVLTSRCGNASKNSHFETASNSF